MPRHECSDTKIINQQAGRKDRREGREGNDEEARRLRLSPSKLYDAPNLLNKEGNSSSLAPQKRLNRPREGGETPHLSRERALS